LVSEKRGATSQRTGVRYSHHYPLPMTESLWRTMDRARLTRLDTYPTSPEVDAARLRAIAGAMPLELQTAADVRQWLLSEALRAENAS
jgi:hypothetical protein